MFLLRCITSILLLFLSDLTEKNLRARLRVDPRSTRDFFLPSHLANVAMYGGAENQEAMITRKVPSWLFPLAFQHTY